MPPIKVMVVEDEIIVAEDIRMCLEQAGYTVTAVVSSGVEALDAVVRTRPDIVLVDIVLAGSMDGIETANCLWEQHRIPSLYVTAYDDTSTMQRAKLTQPIGYLLKPFNERQLLASLEIAIHQHMRHERREAYEPSTSILYETYETLKRWIETEEQARRPRRMISSSDHVAPARIFVVDDQPLERQGLVQLLSVEPDMIVCGEADDAEQTTTAFVTSKPDMVIMSLMQPVSVLLNLINTLLQLAPAIPVLVSSTYEEHLFAQHFLDAGARGYILKQETTEALLAAIRQMLRGETYISGQLSTHLLNRSAESGNHRTDLSLTRLSNREVEVLQLLGQGYTSRQIAELLNLSIKTIETYRVRLMDKLSVDNATELVQYAIRWAHGGVTS